MDEKTSAILERYSCDKASLIAILQDIQAEHNYLPESALEEASQKLRIPLSAIYGMATFYAAFSLKPRGKHTINVCMGTACHVRGAPRVLDRAREVLKIEVGQTTSDKLFTLNTVFCLGACALGPLVVINKKYYGNLAPSDFESILKKHLSAEKHAG